MNIIYINKYIDNPNITIDWYNNNKYIFDDARYYINRYGEIFDLYEFKNVKVISIIEYQDVKILLSGNNNITLSQINAIKSIRKNLIEYEYNELFNTSFNIDI